MKKFVLIGKLNMKEQNNGPSGVFFSLKENLSYKDSFISISVKSIKDCLKILRYNDDAICVCSDGFKVSFILFVISCFFPNKNKYYLVVNGLYCIDKEYFESYNKKTLFLERLLYKRFDNLICVSELQKKIIAEKFKRRKNVYVIHNGVEKNNNILIRKNANSDCIKLVMVGGLRIEKGIFLCLELIEKLSKVHNVRLDIWGGTDGKKTEKKFYNILKQKNLEEFIHFNGYSNNKEVIFNAYREADFSLALSYFDTYNISVLESMQYGCIPIVSDRCGVSEVINREEIVLEFENVVENAFQIICKLYHDSQLSNDIIVNNYKIANKLQWYNVSEIYYDLLIGYNK